MSLIQASFLGGGRHWYDDTNAPDPCPIVGHAYFDRFGDRPGFKVGGTRLYTFLGVTEDQLDGATIKHREKWPGAILKDADGTNLATETQWGQDANVGDTGIDVTVNDAGDITDVASVTIE